MSRATCFERWLGFIVRAVGFRIYQICSQMLVLPLISFLTWAFKLSNTSEASSAVPKPPEAVVRMG